MDPIVNIQRKYPQLVNEVCSMLAFPCHSHGSWHEGDIGELHFHIFDISKYQVRLQTNTCTGEKVALEICSTLSLLQASKYNRTRRGNSPLGNVNIATALHAVTSCVVVKELLLVKSTKKYKKKKNRKNSQKCKQLQEEKKTEKPGQKSGESHWPAGWSLRTPAKSEKGKFKTETTFSRTAAAPL